jgi:hypothetical protein
VSERERERECACTTIINDDTFMRNVKVQFCMEFYAVLCSNILNCI